MDFVELLRTNDISGLKYIINSTKDINQAIILDDDSNLNYLHVCASVDTDNRNEVLKLLLSRKDLNINAQSGHSNHLWTALHISASWGYSDTLLLLLNHGGDPYLIDSNGRNVWDLCSSYDNYECLHVLESNANRDSQKSKDEQEEYKFLESDVFNIEKLIEIEATEGNDGSDSNSSQETVVYSLNGDDESDKETKIYFDKSSNLTLVERKCNSKQNIELRDDEVPSFDSWSCSMIELKLSNLGLSPVPVTPTTRSVYAKQVFLLENNLSPSPLKKCLKYSEELHSFIDDSVHDNDKIKAFEEEFQKNFRDLKSSRTCFTYLLLDPRVTQNIQSQINGVVFDKKNFEKFLESIFYIGKGQKSRPMQHLFEAIKYMGKSCVKESMKVKRIREIWKVGRGVVSLNCFHNITSSEALSREFCMLSAIRVENVTNVLRGNNTLRNLKWNDHKRSFFGASLLLKAYYALLIEGEREIRPADIKK